MEKKIKTRKRVFISSYNKYFLILPVIIIIGIFTVYPLIEGVRTSFTDKNLLKEEEQYIGFNNYTKLADDEVFWLSLRHSIILTIVVVLLQFVFGLILAWAMKQKVPGMPVFKSIIMASWVIPVAATVIMFKFMAQPDIGFINIFLKLIGFGDLNKYWFGDINTAFPFIVILHLWRNIPFYGIAFLAAMHAVPESYYDAASIDGANGWQKFRYVTLPCIRNIIIVMITIHVLWTFNNFDFVYLATGGGPVYATNVLPVYVYRKCWTSYSLGQGASMGTIMYIILMIYFIIYIKISGREEKT
jgi:ABC-type sugar transport system permease subunit